MSQLVLEKPQNNRNSTLLKFHTFSPPPPSSQIGFPTCSPCHHMLAASPQLLKPETQSSSLSPPFPCASCPSSVSDNWFSLLNKCLLTPSTSGHLLQFRPSSSPFWVTTTASLAGLLASVFTSFIPRSFYNKSTITYPLLKTLQWHHSAFR